jgi:hypothetical protein
LGAYTKLYNCDAVSRDTVFRTGSKYETDIGIARPLIEGGNYYGQRQIFAHGSNYFYSLVANGARFFSPNNIGNGAYNLYLNGCDVVCYGSDGVAFMNSTTLRITGGTLVADVLFRDIIDIQASHFFGIGNMYDVQGIHDQSSFESCKFLSAIITNVATTFRNCDFAPLGLAQIVLVKPSLTWTSRWENTHIRGKMTSSVPAVVRASGLSVDDGFYNVTVLPTTGMVVSAVSLIATNGPSPVNAVTPAGYISLTVTGGVMQIPYYQ